MTFLKEDLDKIIQAIKKLADSGQEHNNPEQEIVKSGKRHYLSEDLTLIAQAIRDLNENNEITVEKSKYLSENLNEIAQTIENIDIIKPEGTIEITQNGNYNISNYANAKISVNSEYTAKMDATYEISSNGTIFNGQLIIDGELSLIIPEGVETIGNSAFRECQHLTSLTIPDSVTYIGDYAFENCASLTSLIIPNSVEVISQGAFGGCISLTMLKLPHSIMEILDYAFVNCYSLALIDLTDFSVEDRIPFLGKQALFDFRVNHKFLFKDQETLNAFASATNWSEYAEHFIVAE